VFSEVGIKFFDIIYLSFWLQSVTVEEF